MLLVEPKKGNTPDMNGIGGEEPSRVLGRFESPTPFPNGKNLDGITTE